MAKRFKLTVSASTFTVLCLLAFNALAYRSDFGFLPPGSSTCDAHVPVTLNIPENSRAIPDPFLGEFSGGFYHVEELRDGLFYMTDGVYQAMFLVSGNGIILVDAPPSIGVNQVNPAQSVSFLDVIYSVPETQGKPIKKMIYTHVALDHIGAAGLVKAAFPQVQVIAHIETKRKIARSSGNLQTFLPGSGPLPPPLPNSTFRNNRSVALGGQVLRLSYHGPIHEPGNIFVYAPKQKVLMLVDVMFPGWAPFNDLALAEDIPLYVKAHDIALSFDFETIVGGHVNRLGDRQDIETQKTYIQDIQANAAAALLDPALFQIFGIVPQHALGAFHIYLDQVACSCANMTLDASRTPSGTPWLQTLGAADINTVGHCWEMVYALRTDPSF
ncbi:MAG: MBL fold metallo-hydrolase [Gammaproteobacteria bacterium]